MVLLCSSSITRANILKEFNIEFKQCSSSFNEEEIKSNNPIKFVYLASKGKMQTGVKEIGLEIPLLSADTVVTDFKQILRKPKNRDDAKRILEAQSGAKISIITSVHLKTKDFLFEDISATTYKFKEFLKDDLEEYLNSNKWQGKAGGCMVEGFCKNYIKEVKGLQSTAMGLQIEKITPWIK